MTDEGPARSRRRVERGEGEVTQWPRGLVSYVPDGAPEKSPDVEEDRTANRLALAARLLGVLRARGATVDRELADLRAAEAAFAAHDRARATRLVDRLLGRIGEISPGADHRSTAPGEIP